MDSRVEKAVKNRQSGYNCSQAVACAFCEELGIDEEQMYQVLEGFGLGMGCMEGVCGAISGAVAIAGMKVNRNPQLPGGNRKETYQISREIITRFKEKNKSIICKELKGVDTGKPLRDCQGCVADAAAILESIAFQPE